MIQTISFEHNGQPYYNWSVASAQETGVPAAVISAAVKQGARSEVVVFTNAYRAQISSASPGKLAEYRFKEEIARDPASAAPAELAMIDREAAARGITSEALLAEINAKASAYRQIALLIGALEAETKAAIAAITEDAVDIEAQIQTVLGNAKALAETAFNDALIQINGGA